MNAAPSHATVLTPVGDSDRSDLIDSLRGFSLLGILVVNFWGSAGTRMPGLDNFVNDAIEVVAQTSFYPLFQFMFGMGFAVQLSRARERGSPVVRLYVRRLLALLLIGTVHRVFIWKGDVLVQYAVLGFLLIVVHRMRDRWLIPIAVLVVAGTLSYRQVGPLWDRVLLGPDAAQLRELGFMECRVPPGGRSMCAERRASPEDVGRVAAYRAAVSERWKEKSVRGFLSPRGLSSDTFGCFLLGFLAGRRKLLQDAGRYMKAFVRTAAFALPLVIAAQFAIRLWTRRPELATQYLYIVEDYGTTILYISSFAIAFAALPRVAARLRVFAAPGKLGLTNYLMQSVVMTLPFEAYGLGLTKPSTAAWFVLNVLFFFAVQVPLSRWWSARYLFGPMEWVWRSLTYGQRQPMRRVT